MLQKIYLMVFERYIPELKKYDSILFLYQPITSGHPLKIVQRHMAHPVCMRPKTAGGRANQKTLLRTYLMRAFF